MQRALSDGHQREDLLRRTVAEHLAFERLVSEVAAQFVNIPNDQVDEAIVDSQRRVVETLDLDRSTLWHWSPDGNDFIYTHGWVRPEYPPSPARVRAKDVFPFLLERLRAGEIVCFSSVEDVPSAVDRNTMVQFGAKSITAFPLTVGGRPLGAIGFGTIRAERHWTPDVVERLGLLATVFAQALARKESQEQLERALADVKQMRDQIARENVLLQHEVKGLRVSRSIPAESAASRQVVAQLESIAPTNATVLLLGETGTGKEVFADAIHALSKRHQRPMVRVHCAAIPLALIESELFGRERGAYTGAVSQQRGRFELANNSTHLPR